MVKAQGRDKIGKSNWSQVMEGLEHYAWESEIY
jgi:hypothetical protein